MGNFTFIEIATLVAGGFGSYRALAHHSGHAEIGIMGIAGTLFMLNASAKSEGTLGKKNPISGSQIETQVVVKPTDITIAEMLPVALFGYAAYASHKFHDDMYQTAAFAVAALIPLIYAPQSAGTFGM